MRSMVALFDVRGNFVEAPGRRHFGEGRLGKGPTFGDALTFGSMTYPKGYARSRYEGGDSSPSLLTTATCSRPLRRKNDPAGRRNRDRQFDRRYAMSKIQRAAVPVTPHANDELLTIQEVADVVRVPVATLRYWRHLGTVASGDPSRTGGISVGRTSTAPEAHQGALRRGASGFGQAVGRPWLDRPAQG